MAIITSIIDYSIIIIIIIVVRNFIIVVYFVSFVTYFVYFITIKIIATNNFDLQITNFIDNFDSYYSYDYYFATFMPIY